MPLLHLYRAPGVTDAERQALLDLARRHVTADIDTVETEICFNIDSQRALSSAQQETLAWLLRETFDPRGFAPTSFLDAEGEVIEVGPRMTFTTAWSTNAVAICHACGLDGIRRIERSRRYLLRARRAITDSERTSFLARVHDRMTECVYPERLESFASGATPEPTLEVPVLKEGRAALERISKDMGLAFDDWDLDYYTRLFAEKIGRDPTNVECFDIAQSNSEHSRHWFFKGRLIIDGEEIPGHLISLVQEPLKANPNNSVVAFNDNSSTIRGYRIMSLLPTQPGRPSPFAMRDVDYDILFTAETHNFPSGVAPFPGAETGTGGRIRDVHATGRGSLVVAGTAAYCVGNLRIPGYEQPWESDTFAYPSNLASPLQIELEASNGASDYGNKFGEPMIQGYTRAFGMRLPNGERREWLKPIMFTGGIGQIDHAHSIKDKPAPAMLVTKIGGPAYRIGMGGGAASSMVQGENVAELDFNAVQRGDAEMEQKVNRVIRACVELGDANPIVSIHDQGAGGNCNVLKEVVEPEGAVIEIRDVLVGDETLSVLEIWGAEYQENDALLLKPEHADLFRDLCEREKVPFAFVGTVTGDGRVRVHDRVDGTHPVDVDLADVLGDMPQKTFESTRVSPTLVPLALPDDLDVRGALERVFRLVSVGSKRFLTTKVDRSVTGLVARQQCAGPLQLTVADVAVIAQSHFDTSGAATAIGEQPIKGLLDPAAMARMAVGEALTNIVWARLSGLGDVRCSANWMWAAKLPGEGAALYDAAKAMRDVMIELGIAVDGGKDSLSMAALAPDGRGGDETVKAPGALVISAYATCPNIRQVVTPDLKRPGRGRLLLVELGKGRQRMGGSALAQVFEQLGDDCPDLDDAGQFKRAFEATQALLTAGQIQAGHDRSDGGLVTTVLEMAFAGNCGVEIDLDGNSGGDAIQALFNEELGLVLEVDADQADGIVATYAGLDVPCRVIGRSLDSTDVVIRHGGEVVLEGDMRELRDLWEETSFELDRRQANPACVAQERQGLRSRQAPPFQLAFTPHPTLPAQGDARETFRVAILREEGSNGDREMTSAFHAAGFETWDVTVSDLLAGRVDLDDFRGIVAVGGFSYADVLDAAKGWAGTIRFHEELKNKFQAFYERPDTFSLGVCNGCQLLALLGWVPWSGLSDEHQVRFVHNVSGRFESRFSAVQIQESPAIMLKGMAGSTLGIWVAHGEGRALFPDASTLERVKREGLAPIRYVDDEGRVTEAYPFNPNGSPDGIAALCSPDGRHLAMMPHPERAFRTWQWGWMPEDMRDALAASPWLTFFQNARRWCEQTLVGS